MSAALADADPDELSAEQGILHQLAAAIQMSFHPGTRADRVPEGNGIDDRKVRFRRPFLKGTEAHAERHEAVHLREAPFNQLEREAVARAGRDRQMKLHVGILGFAIILRGDDRNCRQPPQMLYVVGGRELSGARGSGALEEPPDIEGVVDLLNRDATDEIPMTNHALEVALLPETSKPFPDGSAAHPMLRCKAHFRKRRAGPILTFDDTGLETPVGALHVGRIH
jgi:hypothetical protein